MGRGPKTKSEIVCSRCNRVSIPVRDIYCRNCASYLVTSGKLHKFLVDDTPKQLTQHQIEILNGLMLGDGCLYRRKITHKPYLAVQRSQIDRNYLTDNYEVFKDFCKKGITDGSVFDKRTQNTTYFSKFVTRRCGVFESYYKLWYPNGYKVVPHDLELTPITLAIWLADDGYVRTSCSEWRLQMQLSCDNFSQNEVDILKKKLENICNEYFFISGEESKISLRIGSSDAGTRAFLRVIDQYFPQSMERKAIWRQKEARFYDNEPRRINPDIGKHGNEQFRK